MVLTRGITRKVPLPHEEGEWVEIRMLSGTQLQGAREVRALRSIELARAMGPELLQMQGPAERPGTPAAAPGAAGRRKKDVALVQDDPLRDPLAQYDRLTLLKDGIVDWSYPAPVTPEEIEELDDETMDLIARELIPPVRSEEARKNGS